MRKPNTVSLDRRQFLVAAVTAALATRVTGETPVPQYTAAVIGHSGRGDYGHAVDQIFTDRDDVQLLAVADPVAEGRRQAMQRSKAQREYEDYRQMLAKERPQLVAIAPRWTDQRRAMCLAAIEAGAHLYTEKPFATDLAEADEILAAAAKMKRKIAVAHQTRLAPSVLHLKKVLDAGLIGELLTIDTWGKQDDRRAGGEDMLVLGTHLFELMRVFAAIWCTARVTEKGKDITSASGRKAGEEIGPVAGDEISAQFAFAKSVQGSFTSRAKVREAVGHWGILLTGTKGSARILNDVFPTIFVSKAAPFNKTNGRTESWQRVEGDPGIAMPESEKTSMVANRRLVDDWIDAIRNDREPIGSGRAATAAIEMVMAVYQAAIGGRRIEFPLTDRRHPLALDK
jgi:predicted dehydrogenase